MDSRTCPHDREIGGSSQLPQGGWFGGVGKCSCCAQTFGFLHSSTHNQDGLIASRTQDETLCRPCGGKTVEYLNPNYERIELCPRVFTIRRKERGVP